MASLQLIFQTLVTKGQEFVEHSPEQVVTRGLLTVDLLFSPNPKQQKSKHSVI